MPIDPSISKIRREYNSGSFNEANAEKDPFTQFKTWFDDAMSVNLIEPTAMILSTSSKEGVPSSRVLLLKHFDSRGFVFFSNYESRKGREIEINPNAAMLFFWDRLERQIRIEGTVEKISQEESNEYFQTRPYKSRLGAWASKQSEILPKRFTLIRKVASLMLKYPVNVPLPPFWGGYRLIPNTFEFWQGRENRLHDRIRYQKSGEDWIISRLYP